MIIRILPCSQTCENEKTEKRCASNKTMLQMLAYLDYKYANKYSDHGVKLAKGERVIRVSE